MRRVLVVGVAAAIVAVVAALVPRMQGTTWSEWRRRFVWSWAAVPSGPLGWVSSRVMHHGHGPIYRLMDESLDLRSDDDLLEVACGSGYFLDRYASHVRHVAGLDLSGIQVDLARTRLAGRIAAGTAEIVQGDAVSLPWEDERFSAVVCNSIDAFPHPARAIAEMRRVLCPGGRAAILLGARVAEGTASHFDPTWGWVWTEPDARRLVEEAGLEVALVAYGWILGGGDMRMLRCVKPGLPDAEPNGEPGEVLPAAAGRWSARVDAGADGAAGSVHDIRPSQPGGPIGTRRKGPGAPH
jgi:SAM-dependent methyltransferase